MRGRMVAAGRWCGKHRRAVRRALLVAVVGALLLGGGTVASVVWIRGGAEGHIYDEDVVPEAPVALVLGTRVDAHGRPSPFLTARLEIARRLFEAGKVRAILVSGDNLDADYNEPGAMRRWLVDRGVPARKVVLDRAGFDTYDSCARAKRIFGVERATVVTQSFHLPRAVALCRRLGIDANGVGDETVRQQHAQRWRVSSTREYGACVKAALDLLSGRDPVRLGPPETGVDDALRDQ
ncbi:SanA/YdcF family protein [Micromonospora avicenniae]|uniref:Protein SanA, affects membrane permeability for vancomycin n=1 Tax=Micromonospora avicenniae TaxID=1198245 RepID=A0A1N6T0U8_9ACTN|nr:ElyC/SanA/YdcF family protein [Micromonospora avicenniae]SIQ46953.1 protein SanA, affects membrane permeability for vancomycin [Micromonospora avicenniae]